MRTFEQSIELSHQIQNMAFEFAFALKQAENGNPSLEGRFEAIRAKNQTPEYLGKPHCASGDFYDANEFMAVAFRMTMGREPFMDSNCDGSPKGILECEADVFIWNSAWNFARLTGLI